jgi:hypothetical protein
MKNYALRVREMSFVVVIALVMFSMTAVTVYGQPGSISITPDYPANVSVGNSNIPATNTIGNTSGFDLSMDVNDIRNDLYCVNPMPNPCTVPDGNTVFTINSPGTGRAGSDCAGTSFNIVPVGPAGSFYFQPAAPFVITSGDNCIIDFTVNANALPAVDANLVAPGIQTYILASVNGTTIVGPLQATGTDITTVSSSASVVPTMTEWGMITFMVLAGISSIFYLRKYRRA